MLDAVQLFRAKVVDVAPDAVTVQVIGNADKLADFLRVLEPFGIRELVQSGMVAIGRGSRSISERTLRPVAVPAPVRHRHLTQTRYAARSRSYRSPRTTNRRRAPSG